MTLHLRTEAMNLRQHALYFRHRCHREAQIRLLDVPFKGYPVERLRCVLVNAASQAVEGNRHVDAFAEHFRADDLLFAPDDEVLETVLDGTVLQESLVHGRDAVDETDVHVGVELSHLVEVDGRKESVAPAKRRVCIDDEIGGLPGLGDDVLEHASSQRVQPLQGDVENLARRDIGRLGVHHIADVAEQHLFAVLGGDAADLLQVALLVKAHHSCDDDDHTLSLNALARPLATAAPGLRGSSIAAANRSPGSRRSALPCRRRESDPGCTETG